MSSEPFVCSHSAMSPWSTESQIGLNKKSLWAWGTIITGKAYQDCLFWLIRIGYIQTTFLGCWDLTGIIPILSQNCPWEQNFFPRKANGW